jgi:hypothetical protein
VRKVDAACLKAEEDLELNASGIAHRRAEFCDQALRTLLNFRPFEIAEKALSENIDALVRLSNRGPEQVQMLQKLTQDNKMGSQDLCWPSCS